MSPSLHASLLSVFGWVLRGSFMAGILIVLILALQFLMKNKLESRWKYLLWIPVVIRLLLPSAPESSLSLYNVFSLEAIAPGIHQQTQGLSFWHKWWKESGTESEIAVQAEPTFVAERNGFIREAAGATDPSQLSVHSQDRPMWWSGFKQLSFTNMLMLAWLSGVLILTVKTVCDQLRLKQALRTGRPIETPRLSSLFDETKLLLGVKRKVRFVASEHIPGPAVVGFYKPVVVISPRLLVTLKKEQIQYILAHEFAHIRRWDVAMNWIMHIVLILHWFNPLVWLAVHRARQDQEIACDACALDRLSPQKNNAYGQTIIHVLEHFSGSPHQPGLAALSATHKQLKRRLTMIKQFQKKSYHMSILGMTMILALGSVTLVDAKESDAKSTAQMASVQSEQDSKAALNKQWSYNLPEQITASSVNLESYTKEQEKAVKKATEAAKLIPAEDIKFIENEINRIKELTLESDDMYVLFHKYKDLNSGLDLSYWGGIQQYTAYEDYLNKAAALEGSILEHPSNLPAGYTFSKARIEGPIEGKFINEVRAEGKKSGKPIYAKKIDWKEAATIRLEYSNGKDVLAISKSTLNSEGSTKKGFFEDDFPAHIYPKYVFWHTDKFEYSISTTTDMPKKQKIEILKAAVKE